MATEYKLSYTAAEIDQRLGNVSQLSENVETLQTNVGAMQTDISTTQTDVSTLQTDIQTKASVMTLSTDEYNALETTDSNTLYMLTDAEEETIEVPTKVSELENDAGYLTSIPDEYITENELTAKGYLTEHQSLDGYATEIYTTSAVSTHNTSTSAHNDIRLLIEGLTTRLNTLADSDDTTLDQMSEVVAYIKSNKDLIDSITTSKVNVSDIIDNLTTNVTNKPLSAAQGVALKALIDTLDSDKLDSSALTSAVEDALAQAKASGEFDGSDGAAGKDGNDGVGISSIKQTTTSTADDGNNIITVTLTNGNTSTFTVQNGSKGSKGDTGATPVRGTDYWTEADKAEIKSYVDEAILGGAW